VDAVEDFFKGLALVSLAGFITSVLMRSCDAALYSGLALVLSILAVHECRLRRLEEKG
jgi:hypothetical protein